MDKKILRKKLLEKRKTINEEQKIKWNNAISQLICDTEYFKNAQQVLVFASTEYEFDTRYIVERCREAFKRVFYPRCIDKDGNMIFFKVDSVGDLTFGAFDILEPKKSCKQYIPRDNDLVIVPCLSADRQKNRIGYGKGYYDRFLKNFNGVSIAPCYSEMLEGEIPTDEYDIKVNIIVTDKEVIK